MPYNTTTEADTYFTARYGYAKWGPLSIENKEAALVSANQVLDLLCTWDGEKTDPEQDNEFPRNGEVETPEAVKTSELEIAYLVVENGAATTEASDSLTKLKAGSVELSFNASSKGGNPLINGTVETLLSPLGQCSFNMGGGSTLSIPVYR